MTYEIGYAGNLFRKNFTKNLETWVGAKYSRVVVNTAGYATGNNCMRFA
jgi:hypothetical protein